MTPQHRFGFAGRRHAPVLDSMASSYFDRLPGVPNATFVAAVHDFIVTGRRQGWINGAPFILYFLSNATPEGVLVNATSPQFSDGTIPVMPFFSQYQGMTGLPGISACIMPNVQWSDVPGATPSNFWAGCYVYADHNNGDTAFGWTGGGATLAIRPHNGVNTQLFGNNATLDVLKSSWSVGLNMIARGDPAFYVSRIGANENLIEKPTAAAMVSGPLGIFRVGKGSTYAASSLSLVAFGSDPLMTGSDRTARDGFQAACDRLMLALGAIQPEDLIPQTDVVNGPNAFGPGALAAVTPADLKVFRNAVAPMMAQDNTSYTAFPGTDGVSVDVVKLNATDNTGWRQTASVWGMRAVPGLPATNPGAQPQPNPVGPPVFRSDGYQAGIECSSYERANAISFATVLWHIGNDAHQADGLGYLDVMNAVGIPDTFTLTLPDGSTRTYSSFIPYGTAQADADLLFTGLPHNQGKRRVITDVAVAPNARMIDAPLANLKRGITWDWEVADYRDDGNGAATTMLLQVCDVLSARGLECHLMTDALNASVSACGLDQSNLWKLHAKMTSMNVEISAQSKERNALKTIQNQLVLLTGPAGDKLIDYSRLTLTINIGPFHGEISLDDVAVCRQWIQGTLGGLPPGVGGRTRPGGVRFANGYGSPGGAPTRRYNEVIATALGLSLDTFHP